MYGVLVKFFSGKTSFTQSEEPIKELPTIVICFSKPYLRKTQYEYGLDFKNKNFNIYHDSFKNLGKYFGFMAE